MADGSEAIAKIRKVVDENQSSIIISKSCLNSQKSLLKKLKQQSEQQHVQCQFISNSNFKLNYQIKLEELKLKSLSLALNTIQSANVEAKKEHLLTIERRCEIEERVRNGIKKYERTWISAKERYEKISFVNNYLGYQNKIHAIQESLNNLLRESEDIPIQVNKKQCELDKERIIELVNFLVIERPRLLKNIYLNEIHKNKINCDIQKISRESNMKNVSLCILPQTDISNTVIISDVTENIRRGSQDNTYGLVLPSIQLQSVDLDTLSVKLDQIKKGESSKRTKRAGSLIFKEPIKRMNTRELMRDDTISSYFNVCGITKADDKNKKHFSNKKLIHILKDIQLDENEAHDIVAKINPYDLQDVTVIKELDDIKNTKVSENLPQEQPIESGDIENNDLNATNSPLNVLPPTQYMDLTQDKNVEVFQHKSATPELKDETCSKKSQEKKVSFDIQEQQPEETQVDSSPSALNTSTVSNDSYTRAKEVMVKKYNLDLSPQFIYSKNTLQTKPKDNAVTSKFFEVKEYKQNVEGPKTTEVKGSNDNKKVMKSLKLNKNDESNFPDAGISQQYASSSKDAQTKTVAGLLFTHGRQGIIESLDLSASTAEYEEGDSDYPHGIDSSLLLSPKADDMPVTNEGTNNQMSQEVPNFLAGLRKTNFSLFGGASSKDHQESTSGNQANNNFTFSFGGEQKKNKGLFSMFR